MSVLSRLLPRSLAARRAFVGYVFVSPFVLGFLLWFISPAVTAGWLAFQDWNMISDPKFVGLDNIVALFSDKLPSVSI